MMKRAHLDWQLAVHKAGANSQAAKIYRKKLESLLDACGPRAPMMEGRC
jgi:hypothetical protein